MFAGCLTPDGAKQLESEAKGFPGSLLTILLDVTNQNSVDSAVGAIKKSLKGKSEYIYY